jgi:hypothetical protein
MFGRKKLYIIHEDLETPSNGIGIFGPFGESEIVERMNDAYADGLASFGSVDVIKLTDLRARRMYINSREYWMEQLAKLEE